MLPVHMKFGDSSTIKSFKRKRKIFKFIKSFHNKGNCKKKLKTIFILVESVAK